MQAYTFTSARKKRAHGHYALGPGVKWIKLVSHTFKTDQVRYPLGPKHVLFKMLDDVQVQRWVQVRNTDQSFRPLKSAGMEQHLAYNYLLAATEIQESL